ncbi:MAG: hypothetical protein JO247_08140, partial [Chloroflexi bacterium]|nr:hypothetical protein [Chloroflexota bacterium]
MGWQQCEAPACEREAIVVLYGAALCHTHHMASIGGLRGLGVLGQAGHSITRDEVLAGLTSVSRPSRRSERTLSPEESNVLTQLALFSGGCTEHALATVWDWPPERESELRAVLARLAARSVVRTEDREGLRRYAVPDDLRARLQHRVEAEAAVASARARFAAYYAQLAEEFEPELWGPAVAAGTAALDREFENLSAAGR